MRQVKFTIGRVKFLCLFSMLAVMLSGCDYLDVSSEEEKCVFRVKTPDDDGKVDYLIFFMLYKMNKLPDSSRFHGSDDYYIFGVNQDCRTVLETLLAKM